MNDFNVLADLQGRLKNTYLPKSESLLPLFEAVVNSIHAIDERKEKDKFFDVTTGRITIRVVRLGEKSANGDTPQINGFSIEDNGIGLDQYNFQSFITLDSQYKASKGCKGIGRLLWLKAFGSVKVASTFLDENIKKTRSLLFNQNGFSENTCILAANDANIGTKIELCNIKPIYLSTLPKKVDTIASRMLEHCLWYFVREGGAPKITITDAEESANLEYIYDDFMGKNSSTESITVKGQKFDVTHLRLTKNHEIANSICYGASSRLVIKEPLTTYIPSLNGKLIDGENEFYYSCLVSSDYLTQNVDSERLHFTFNIIPSGVDDAEITLQNIREGILSNIKTYLKIFLKEKREQATERLNDFIANKSPRYRPIVARMSDEEKDFDPNISDKDLDLKLHAKLFQVENEMLKQGHDLMNHPDVVDIEDYKKRLEQYLQSASDIKQSDLASYVSQRRVVIDLFEKALMLNKDDKYSKEDVIHRLIMPKIKTSDDVFLDNSNLWLIDERLAFHNYMASDKSIKSMPVTENDSDKRPDIATWRFFESSMLVNEKKTELLSSITIVEFKRPMRDDFNSDDPKSNPIKQVLRYVDLIREGKAITDEGRPLTIKEDAQAFCYIIVDLTPSMRKVCFEEEFNNTSDKQGYYRYYNNRNAYVEVISFFSLVQRSKERNRTFFDKLGLPTN